MPASTRQANSRIVLVSSKFTLLLIELSRWNERLTGDEQAKQAGRDDQQEADP
jgi:hypothetical protein